MRRRSAYLLTLFSFLTVFACDRVTPVAPVGSTITISVNPSRIDAEGEAALVTIIVRKEDGTPVNPGTQVNVSTTLGTLDPEVTFTDETGVAKSQLTGDGRIGMATVSATTGAAALVSVEVQIGSVAASITLTATPSNVPKDPQGDEGVIELLALIRDDTGAPLGGGVVNFFAETGVLASRGGPIVTNDLGEARDTLTVTRNDISTLLDPFFLVGAETAIEGGSLILDELEIDIRGVPSTLTIQATPTSIVSTGGSTTLAVQVRDQLGDPLPGILVNFFTELGQLDSLGAPLETNQLGRVEDTLRVSKQQIDALGSTTFRVSAEAGGFGGQLLEDTATIQIVSATPFANFSFVVRADNRTVDFTFTGSCSCTLSYAWDFQNDGTVDAITENPTFTYPTSGTFTVLLRVENSADPSLFDTEQKPITLP